MKWAGNKHRLAGLIEEAFDGPCKGVYYEPFIGSGAVYLHRKAHQKVERAVLSDANPKLIAFHVMIRDQVDDVLEELSRLPGDDFRERYYEQRDLYNRGTGKGPLHAARFAWLNRAGFNGLYRENLSGQFNVPVGRYKKLSIPTEARFREVSESLAGTELVTGSFEDVVKRAGEGDQVYCDPPYVPLSATAAFTAYCKAAFGFREQQQLAREAMRAAFRGAQVVLSNHDLPVVRNELYPVSCGFRVASRPMVMRAISRKASSRGKVGEVIAVIGPLKQVA